MLTSHWLGSEFLFLLPKSFFKFLEKSSKFPNLSQWFSNGNYIFLYEKSPKKSIKKSPNKKPKKSQFKKLCSVSLEDTHTILSYSNFDSAWIDIVWITHELGIDPQKLEIRLQLNSHIIFICIRGNFYLDIHYQFLNWILRNW